MKFSTTPTLLFTGLIASQTLTISARKGSIVSLSSPSVIAANANKHYDNMEFDRGQDCDSDEDTGNSNAVFIFEDGANLADVIIGARQLEGVHCKGVQGAQVFERNNILMLDLGACTSRNVYFPDVCEGKSRLSAGY